MAGTNRSNNHRAIMDALIASKMAYKVLNESGGLSLHVRVSDFGDIWPTSGTMKRANKWTRNDPSAVIASLLRIDMETGEILDTGGATMNERIEELERRIDELEVAYSHMQQMLGS